MLMPQAKFEPSNLSNLDPESGYDCMARSSFNFFGANKANY
jgi:hypothetical protein